MNKQRLQDIANNTRFVNDSDVTEIKQLIGKYPFYALPHVVLARIFFEKEHYLFENALTQAAMRVSDREWLYHYVHGDQLISDEKAGQMAEGTKVEVPGVEDIAAEAELTESAFIQENTEWAIPEEPTGIRNDISEFLETLPVSANETTDEESVEKDDMKPVDERALITEPDPDSPAVHEMVVEEDIEDIGNTDNGVEEAATLNIALNLRKHPVYNVEEFLQSDKQGEAYEERDFFYWLEHPQQEEKKTEEKPEPPLIPEKEKKLSIIDQFIMANPGISRPKKEFFNAENMARKSEQLNNDFVTETLANIYYEQGNIDMAIDAYEKLSLQNPLKQAYFASLIEKIKKEKR